MTSAVFKIKPQSFLQEEEETNREEEEPSSSIFSKAQEKIQNEPHEQEKQFPFENENDLQREIERGQAQSTSRILENVAGFPGDVQSIIKQITGFQPGIPLPTSQGLKKFSEKATLGYTKPKNEFEEKTGDIAGNIGSMMIPGSKTYNAFRNIAIPVAGGLLKEGLEQVGTEEGKADLAKIGFMFALDLASQRKGFGGGAKKVATDIINMAEKSTSLVPQFNASNIKNEFENLKSYLLRGGGGPTVDPIITKIEEFLQKVDANGMIDSLELPHFRKKVNTLIENMGGFDPSIPKSIKKKTIFNLNKFKDVLNQADNEYALSNPMYGKLSKAGNEAFSAYSQSNVASNFLKRAFGDKIKSGVVKSLLGIGGPLGYASFKAPIIGLIGGGAGAATAIGLTTYKYLTRIMKSPILRKYYTELLKGSLSGNVNEVAKNLKPLEKDAILYEKNQKVHSNK
jgi:hypothetical protein